MHVASPTTPIFWTLDAQDQCVAKTTTPRFATKIALTEPRNLHLWKQALQIIGTTSLGWVRLRAVKIEKVGGSAFVHWEGFIVHARE